MSFLYNLLITIFFVSLCRAQNNTSDIIGFPEVEENPDLKNKENRQPVFIPAMCPVNEWYYPGDQKDDWICDCIPAYLYHPNSDKCWAAYRQGPCPDGSYLILPENSVIPVCEKNPCNIDSYVLWNGKCEKLGSRDPCNFMYPLPASLAVNATTLVVSCVKISFNSRISDSTQPTKECPPGCKRSVTGRCVPLSF